MTDRWNCLNFNHGRGFYYDKMNFRYAACAYDARRYDPGDEFDGICGSRRQVYVGGVAMSDGDYLAVGATETQTTKPSDGYAYYKDGTLTLNNYSYEGEGYLYSSEDGYYTTVFTRHDLTLELVGTNTLTQTAEKSNVICV